jgi:hypothetical protein
MNRDLETARDHIEPAHPEHPLGVIACRNGFDDGGRPVR